MKLSVKIILALFALSLNGFAQGNERPIKDDVGFCWNLNEMKRLMFYLKGHNLAKPPERGIVAAISPHDDYLYAARVYFPLYQALHSKEVVIFGVTHSTVRSQIGDPHNVIILDNYKLWHGLLHPISISPLRDFIKAHLDTSDYIVSNRAHELEHSIEALLPFLQYYNPDVKITPIMVTQMPFEKMDDISDKLSIVISEYIKANHLVLGKDIAFLISSDANHYGPDFNNSPFGLDSTAHREATNLDKRIANSDLAGRVDSQKVEDFTEEMKKVVWCGKFSIPFGLLTVEKVVHNVNSGSLVGKIIAYSDSFSEGVIPIKNTRMGTTAPFSLKHWVGWLSAAYYVQPKE
jgi:AmmeMemoRadiSam system protein B